MKKVLVLSGGGSHGAYQVGVLKRLIETGKSWDVIAGVSVGALNGTYLAMRNKAEIARGMEELESIWLSIRGTEDVIKPWLPGFLNYFPAYFKGSLKSTKPLLKLIQSKFDGEALKNSDVDLRVGTVALCEGKFHTIKKDAPNLPLWILASSTMPVVMPPVELDGDKWVDGGVRNQTPLVSIMDVVRDCERKGECVEVDVVLTGPTHDEILVEQPKNVDNLLQVALRCAQIAIDEIYLTDLEIIKGVGHVTIYEPSKPLLVDPMEFPPAAIRTMIQTGYEETVKKLR